MKFVGYFNIDTLQFSWSYVTWWGEEKKTSTRTKHLVFRLCSTHNDTHKNDVVPILFISMPKYSSHTLYVSGWYRILLWRYMSVYVCTHSSERRQTSSAKCNFTISIKFSVHYLQQNKLDQITVNFIKEMREVIFTWFRFALQNINHLDTQWLNHDRNIFFLYEIIKNLDDTFREHSYFSYHITCLLRVYTIKKWY